jgi:hypothetical protein
MKDTNPHRTAWILIVIFSILSCGLGVGIPYGVWHYVQTSTLDQKGNLTVTSGSTLMYRADTSLPEAVTGTLLNLPADVTLVIQPESQAIVAFNVNDNEALSSFQLYSNTIATFRSHTAPRFEYSSQPYRQDIRLDNGRLRVNIPPNSTDQRPLEIQVSTPQALVVLQTPGSYTIESDRQSSDVIVGAGQATVWASDKFVIVLANQRTSIQTAAAPTQPSSAPRNIIRNGNFTEQLNDAWTSSQNRDDRDQPAGSITQEIQEGLSAIHFYRLGSRWAKLEITQNIERDIRDVQSAQLHLAVWLSYQDLTNCGIRGSECPLMISIDYIDAFGNPQQWVQGFYYLRDTANNAPTRCVTCPPNTGELRLIKQGSWNVYDSPNLIEALASSGQPPTAIKAIHIYAEGHSFESYVAEVELRLAE